MKPRSTGRLFAAVLMGLLYGLYIHRDIDTWSHRGREAFLAYQGHRFDRDMLVPRHSIAGVVGAVIFVCLFILIYELIAAGVAKLVEHGEEKPLGPGQIL